LFKGVELWKIVMVGFYGIQQGPLYECSLLLLFENLTWWKSIVVAGENSLVIQIVFQWTEIFRERNLQANVLQLSLILITFQSLSFSVFPLSFISHHSGFSFPIPITLYYNENRERSELTIENFEYNRFPEPFDYWWSWKCL